ncbi:PIN domain-containing protein [bacterium]|nr:PIN domain-containing protein [bacterium]
MKYELDTCVVIRLLLEDPAEMHAVALQFLNAAVAAGDQVLLSDLVVSETYFALQHHYQVTKASAIESLRRLLAGGEIHASGHAEEVLAVENLATAKPGFVDRLIHAGSANSGCQWVTFEKSASKLRDTLVLKST